MDDLRKNLNRGRGYLSYQVPKRYAAWATELPNPMQLQMSMGAQIKEMVDDTAHVLTLAAIMAAPFTGGASLAILAVLAPIQAASSLYNIVNRAAYGDLEMDEEAVFDFINIASASAANAAAAAAIAVSSRSEHQVCRVRADTNPNRVIAQAHGIMRERSQCPRCSHPAGADEPVCTRRAAALRVR
jgi:hypothetical protein